MYPIRWKKRMTRTDRTAILIAAALALVGVSIPQGQRVPVPVVQRYVDVPVGTFTLRNDNGRLVIENPRQLVKRWNGPDGRSYEYRWDPPRVGEDVTTGEVTR